MTLAGWRRFVETPTAHFELLSEKRWVALTGRDKEAYDEARLNYHSEMIIVATSQLAHLEQLRTAPQPPAPRPTKRPHRNRTQRGDHPPRLLRRLT
jgi:hypothetical protein